MSKRTITRTLLDSGLSLAAVYATWATLRRREEREQNSGLAKGKRFLVLGSGFAGAAVAQELGRLLHGSENGEILLIDADNYLLFTPMLTEAAGGELDPRHIISPARTMHSRVDFVQGRITNIDLENKSIDIETGSDNLQPAKLTFAGDHLVIALGSVTSYHNLPGVEEHSIPMKKLEDASAAFDRVSACLERAAVESDPAKRKELLTFVVGGGGYTGVETMAALNDLVRTSVESLPKIRPEEVRTLIIHPGDRLLPEISAHLAEYATRKLKERGVEIRLKAEISGAGEGYVEVKGGERIPTRTLIWAAGVTPNPLIEKLSVPKGKHHGLTVDACCQVPGHPGVWALGDCAEIPQPDGKGTYAPTAQNATREGKLVAQNIVRSLHGEPTQVFRYTPIGELALVGRHTGVASVYGHNFSGLIAWAMWRAVYLAKMPSVGQQGRILSDWILDIVFGREPVPLSSAKGNTP
jgi:NADH dehydrogenase